MLISPAFAGLLLRLSGDLLLNGGRRPEPQTRGKTHLRSGNYFFLLSILPLNGVSYGQKRYKFLCVRDIGQDSGRSIVRWREFLQLRRSHRGAMACRMANRQIARSRIGRKKWVKQEKSGEQYTHRNLPQPERSAPAGYARKYAANTHVHPKPTVPH
jgi:hypothetical protein